MKSINISSKKNIFLSILILVTLSIASTFIANIKKVEATYDGGRIIDDGVFLNAKSMTASDIQNFLVSKNSGLKNMNFVLSCYGAGSQERTLYTQAGATCDIPIPASHIIYFASQIYGVNPRVILATMQKEQSLTTAPNPTSWQLNQAMGYACPTSGQCGGNSTFPYQIDSGTWALRYHFERARGNNNWWNASSSWTCGTEKNYYKPSLYPGQNVRFYDQNGVHYRTHFIVNAATSAFYCYTPHAYNNPQGLYSRPPYGTTGMYYSGSYNFVYFYEIWFGSTQHGSCRYPGYTSDIIYRLYNPKNSTQLLTKDPMEVCSATATGWLLDGSISKEPSSNKKPVYRLRAGSTYLFTDSITERDSAISNYGYKLEGTAFYGIDATQDPTNARPVYRVIHKNKGYIYTTSQSERDKLVNEGNKFDRISFYTTEVPGIKITPTYRLSHFNGSYLFTTSSQERDSAVKGYGYRYEGVGFNVITQLNQVTIPVYRLAGSGGYLFTTSLNERISAIALGYRDEGVGFYTYGSMNDPSLKSIYRLSRVGSYFYTQSHQEAVIGRDVHSFRLEGVGFQTP